MSQISMSPPVTSSLHNCCIFTASSLGSHGSVDSTWGPPPSHTRTHSHHCCTVQGPDNVCTDPMPRTHPWSVTRSTAFLSFSSCLRQPPGTSPLLDWSGPQIYHLVSLTLHLKLEPSGLRAMDGISSCAHQVRFHPLTGCPRFVFLIASLAPPPPGRAWIISMRPHRCWPPEVPQGLHGLHQTAYLPLYFYRD
jgi:hypothetical protein